MTDMPRSPVRSHLRLVDGSAHDELGVDGDGDGDGDGDAPEAIDGSGQERATGLSPRFVVVALIAFQLLAMLSNAGRYFTLVRGDDVYRVAALLTVPASLCLYAGALSLILRPGRGRSPFLVAAIGLGLSLPAWGVSASWTWPMAFGAMLALAGAWYARAAVRHADPDAAQP